jgi:hypothetical protein
MRFGSAVGLTSLAMLAMTAMTAFYTGFLALGLVKLVLFMTL